MKIIAHRANINGPDPKTENSPDQIVKCINAGYDVEIDIRCESKTNTIWLGHDESQYIVTWYWLKSKQNNLWIHCKDFSTLHEFSTMTSEYNYFWHQEDDYTLTSKNYIWAYPGKKHSNNTVIVMPEWNYPNWDKLKVTNCYGICTDYPEKIK